MFFRLAGNYVAGKSPADQAIYLDPLTNHDPVTKYRKTELLNQMMPTTKILLRWTELIRWPEGMNLCHSILFLSQSLNDANLVK